jgi:protein-ribulosamine 3-kinase
MEPELRAAVAEALGLAGGAAAVTAAVAASGGCIHRVWRVTLGSGAQVFAKANAEAPADTFVCEAAGLRALAAGGELRVPRVLAVGAASGTPFLVLEHIETGRPGPSFAADFGRQLAAHHLATRHPRCGLDHDNYLGATPQPNGWMEDWCTFWRERRLGYQLELARRRGLADPELTRLGERLMARLDEWLAAVPDEVPCLLHGDLWGGNYLVGPAGEPVVLDPAVYYGHREADLAMTRLFGGFDRAFYAAYQERWPLPPASEQRLAIYELYHLLNHLNLFGLGYRTRCLQTLRGLV